MHYDIVIIGGGTAGWLSAAYLSFKNPNKQICLIESPDIPTIGVGEGTFPTTMKLLSSIGITPEEMIVKTNGGLKVGIKYIDFADKDFWLTTEPHWEHFGSDLVKTVGNLNKSPVLSNEVFFGCHFVASELADLLKQYSTKSSVTHISANIVSSTVINNTCFDVTTDTGLNITGSWFIDCSGFARLLTKQTTSKFKSYDNELLVDSAVVGQLPYTNFDKEFVSYTQITARPAGWQFKIPTFKRTGNGYVYSSKFTSSEDAEALLKETTGVANVKHIKMQLGYYQTLVNGNIISVGLSGGFIEPLEATAIHISEQTLQQFQKMLDGDINAEDANNYMSNKIRYIKTLILGHYAFSQRTDDFWVKAKECAFNSLEIQEFFKNLKNGQYPTADDTLDEAYPYGQWNELLKGFNLPHYYPHINSEAKKQIFMASYYLPEHSKYIKQLRIVNE